MWREYSLSSIKKNKAASISITACALIASVFLSFICSLFYNFWQYDISKIIYQEGDWQGRITGNIQEEDIETMKMYASVTNIIISNSMENTKTADIYFENRRDVYKDLPKIAAQIGYSETAIQYHDKLLSQYLIFNPQDKQPPMLLTFFLMVIVIASSSLILIIHNAFSVSMTSRIHQMGILSSVGATPGQIERYLLSEAAVLCGIPILLGSICGTGFCSIFIQFANRLGSGQQEIRAVFQYHPIIGIITIIATFLTVFLSAWWPARKMSKITPLEAIRTVLEQAPKRKKKICFLSKLFGIEGEIAENALYARKKALRTSSISLTLSFLAFTIFLCFMTLSGISTKYTYFEKYKNAWDIMISIYNTPLSDVSEVMEISQIEGIDSLYSYQKAVAYTVIHDEQLAVQLKEIGGISLVAGSSVQSIGTDFAVQVPMIILDDSSFMGYCEEIGVEPQTDGAILINRIWDSVNSNFRYPQYIPFLKEGIERMELTDAMELSQGAQIPILAYTAKLPVLREEYTNYSLVQIVPESLWSGIKTKVESVEKDTYLRILVSDDLQISNVESKIKAILKDKYVMKTENRIEKESSNSKLWRGYLLIVGALCGLLALIGIANIFSNTLGFLYQRKREFARYLSVGVTPEGIRKILWIEAFTIAGRPILVTLPLTAVFVLFSVTASYLKLSEFLEVLPLIPIVVFILIIILMVGLAYFIGGKRLLSSDLSELLKNDALI